MTSQVWQRVLVLCVVSTAVCGCGPPDDEELDGGWFVARSPSPSISSASTWLLEPAPEDDPPREREPVVEEPEAQVPPDEQPAAELAPLEPVGDAREVESSPEEPALDLPLDGFVEEEGEDVGVELEEAPEPPDPPGVMIVERLEDEEPPRLATLIAGTAEGVELVEVVEVL